MFNLNLYYLISFFFLVYFTGCLGIILNRNNCLLTLLCIELMYLGIIFSFIILSKIQLLSFPYVYALLILILAACESAIGLGILVNLYKSSKNVSFYYRCLHG